MALFDHLAQYYDDLFPVSPITLNFLQKLFSDHGVQTVADIACGTGRYSLALAEAGYQVVGMDLDAAMIAQAETARQELSLPQVRFSIADMRALQHLIQDQDAVICIGNSLANLTDLADIRRTVAEFYSVLKPGGILVLQLVNFDRHRHSGLVFADIVRSEARLRFQRAYIDTAEDLIRFATCLEFPCPENPENICREEDSTLLYPLTSDIMTDCLRVNGFTDIQLLGTYDGQAFSLTSPASIYVARRPQD